MESSESVGSAPLSLTDRLVAGDPAALEELVEESLLGIERFVRARPALVAWIGESVDDLVQSIRAEALERMREGFEYRDHARFLAWLDRLAATCMMAKARNKPLEQVSISEISAIVAFSPEWCGSLEELNRLVEVLEGLPRNYGRSIYLRKTVGLGYPEIAEVLGGTEHRCWLVCKRALSLLVARYNAALPPSYVR